MSEQSIPTVEDLAPVPVAPDELAPTLEALLLMVEEPADVMMLADATATPVEKVEETLAELAEFYDKTGRGFQLRAVAGGWRFYTRPQYHDRLADWVKAGGQNKLTQAGMETLSVIAYLQPVARSRVSAVRGVNVDGVVRTLLARGLVDEEGIDPRTGAGLLVTTDYFLSRLGLQSLAELPDIAPMLPDATTLESELSGLADMGDAGDTGNDAGKNSAEDYSAEDDVATHENAAADTVEAVDDLSEEESKDNV